MIENSILYVIAVSINSFIGITNLCFCRASTSFKQTKIDLLISHTAEKSLGTIVFYTIPRFVTFPNMSLTPVLFKQMYQNPLALIIRLNTLSFLEITQTVCMVFVNPS